jgi:hypothetical protein
LASHAHAKLHTYCLKLFPASSITLPDCWRVKRSSTPFQSSGCQVNKTHVCQQDTAGGRMAVKVSGGRSDPECLSGTLVPGMVEPTQSARGDRAGGSHSVTHAHLPDSQHPHICHCFALAECTRMNTTNSASVILLSSAARHGSAWSRPGLARRRPLVPTHYNHRHAPGQCPKGRTRCHTAGPHSLPLRRPSFPTPTHSGFETPGSHPSTAVRRALVRPRSGAGWSTSESDKAQAFQWTEEGARSSGT